MTTQKSSKSTAITQAEYNEFFDENITIKRHKELRDKINKRIDSLNDDYFQSEGDFDLEFLEKQMSEQVFHCNDTGILYSDYSDDYSCEGLNYLSVKFLWDDEYLNSIIANIEKNREDEMQERVRRSEEIKKAASILQKLSKEDQKVFVGKDADFLIKVTTNLK